MRGVICVRVSPRPVENVRYSPEIQEQKGRDWADQNGVEVVGVIRDILVSGGASNRFESIMRALEELRPTHFIVSDLSRWTRDRPSRFWAIKAILEDAGVKLVSVDEPWVDSDQPFADSITTVSVEANFRERLRIKKKTSDGVRSAWASGKRWGKALGWKWNPERREYDIDVPLIAQFYREWNEGTSTYEMGRRYNMTPPNVHAAIKAQRQREIVGDEVWDAAQRRHGQRVTRRDARRSNIYRGLLICPSCGRVLKQAGKDWGIYRCQQIFLPHEWSYITSTKWVTPVVAELLGRLRLEPADAEGALGLTRGPRIVRVSPEEVQARMDRLAEAYVLGRISQSKHEELLAELRRQLEVPPEPPVSRVEVEELVNAAREVDLLTRDPDEGVLVNGVLTELFTEIRFGGPKSDVRPVVRERYQDLFV